MNGAAVNTGWAEVLQAAGWTITTASTRRDGLQAWGRTGDGRAYSLILSQAPELDGYDWLHASLYVGEEATPTYADMTLLHRAAFGRQRWAYQVFAPAARHISIKNALHLWGRADGQPALPDFAKGGETI